MKKKFLLALPIVFLLSACQLSDIFGKSQKETQHVTETEIIDDEGAEEYKVHATTLEQKTAKSFYLKVGETKDVVVNLSPTPTDVSEREVKWEINGSSHISLAANPNDPNNTYKRQVTGLTPGVATLVCTSTYNKALTKTFTINVIEFNEDNQYLWEYDKELDKGRINSAEGVVSLHGMTWDYSRSPAIKTGTYYDAISFGGAKEPEARVTFTTNVSRNVLGVSIKAGSMNSQAKLTVKVGDVYYIDEVTVDRVSNNLMKEYASEEITTPVKGLVTIEFITPDYDMSLDGDEDYQYPGTLWLKAIGLDFENAPDYQTKMTYNFREMYNAENETPLSSLTGSPKMVEIDEENILLTLNGVKKEDKTTITGVAYCNDHIDIAVSRPNEVISKVEFKVEYGTSSATQRNVFYLATSKCGGSPYEVSTVYNDADGLLTSYIFTDNVTHIRFVNKNSYNVGLDYLVVSTRTGSAATIKNISTPTYFRPSNVEYAVGDVFSTEGLPNLFINYNEEGVGRDALPPTELVWYDGPSYDNNPATATQELQLGTTYVYGVFRDTYVVKVENITVTDVGIEANLIKSKDALNNLDHYYLICSEAKALIKGTSNADIKTSNAVFTLADEEVGETVFVPPLYKTDYFVLKPQSNGKFRIQNSGDYLLGMTEKFAISAAKSPYYKDFDIEVDENGMLTLKIENSDGTTAKYLSFDKSGSKLQLTDEASKLSNLSFYKIK